MHARVAKSTQIYYFQSLPVGLVGLLVRWAAGNLWVLPHLGHLCFLPLVLRAFPVSTLPSAPHQHTGWVTHRIRQAPWLSRSIRVFLSLPQLHSCTGSSFQLLSSRDSHLETPAFSSLPESEGCCSFSDFLQEKNQCFSCVLTYRAVPLIKK